MIALSNEFNEYPKFNKSTQLKHKKKSISIDKEKIVPNKLVFREVTPEEWAMDHKFINSQPQPIDDEEEKEFRLLLAKAEESDLEKMKMTSNSLKQKVSPVRKSY